MKPLALIVGVSLFIGGSAGILRAQDGPAAASAPASAPAASQPALTKEQIAERRKAIEAQLKKLREQVRAGDATAAERKALADAEKAFHERKTNDPALAQQREAVKQAEAALAKLIEEKVAADAGVQKVKAGLQDQPARQAALKFEQEQFELNIENAGSPLVVAAEADAKVAALRQALIAAEKEIAEKPDPATVAARKAVEAAEQNVRELRGKGELAPLFKALNEAEQALDAAKDKDPREAELSKARKALDAARAAKRADLADAKPVLEKLAQVEVASAANQAGMALIEASLDVYRSQVLASGDADVAAAQAKVAQAEKALDAAIDASPLGKERAELRAAQTARDTKVEALVAADPKYKAAVEAQQAADAKIKALTAKLKDLTPAEVGELAAAQLASAAAAKEAYYIRRDAWSRPEVAAEYKAANTLYHGYHGHAGKAPELAPLQAAVTDAEKQLRTVADTKVASLPAAAALIQKRDALAAAQRETAFNKLLLTRTLSDADSPIARLVEADVKVAEARKAVSQLEAEIKAKPTPEVAAATEQAKAARAAFDAALAKNAEYQAASAAHKTAEAELKAAEGKDARREAVRKAREEYLAARKAAALASPAGKAAAEQLQKLTAEREAISAEGKALETAIAAARKALETGSDADIVAAREKAKAAAAAVKAAEIGPEITALDKAVADARKALEAKTKEAAEASAEHKALVEELGALKDAEKQFKKAAPKAAPKEKAPATAPASAPASAPAA